MNYVKELKRGDNIQSYLKRYNSENLQFENFEKSLSRSGVEVIHNFDYERSIYRLKTLFYIICLLSEK